MASAWLLLVLVLALAIAVAGKDCSGYTRVEKKKTVSSQWLTSRPGDVNEKFYFLEPPAHGHFATVDFDAELLYENGERVPLTDVYLHHWIVFEFVGNATFEEATHYVNMNNPTWSKYVRQWIAKGGEFRHMNSYLPSPYGAVSGGTPEPSRWMLNIHGIDTRGALDRMACTECRCNLFSGQNFTKEPLPPHYGGGLKCCHGETRCKLRDDVNGNDASLLRRYRLKYTWTFIDFDECIKPVTQLSVDVTVPLGEKAGPVEYDIDGHCEPEDAHKPECIHTRESLFESPIGGNLVYAIGHVHAYGLDQYIYREDGSLLCHSPPIYGHGTAPGDEKGYVVGIQHCVNGAEGLGRIEIGEKLRYVVTYTRVDGPHTGVMGVMFLKVYEEPAIATSVNAAAALPSNRKLLN